MDWLLYDAVNGPAEEVTEILRKNPTINVNWRNDRWFGRTPLHRACWGGHDTIVSSIRRTTLDGLPFYSPVSRDAPLVFACC